MNLNKPRKPSDFIQFCVIVHSASASFMELEQYMATYDELLHLLFWNYDIDMPLLVAQKEIKYWGVDDED